MLLRILPVNDPPTLGPIPDVVVNQNSGAYTVNLSGITSGANNEAQTLTVTAVSSNRAVVPDPQLQYVSPNTGGALTFTPVGNASGWATIAVTVDDGQPENNAVTRTFAVEVRASANTQPIVNAGSDKSVTLPSSVALAGSVTDDGLPNPPGAWTASWSQISGPGTVTFNAPNQVASSASFSLPGRYVLRLTANDGQYSASDDVEMDVIDETGPVVADLSVIAMDARTITLGFTTDEPAACSMEYGTTDSFGAVVDQSSFATNHVIALTNLQPGTSYFVRVRSVDQAGNVSFTETMTVSTPPVAKLIWAAEDGTLAYPMSIGTNATALNGRYVSSPSNEQGSGLYPVQVPVASQYRVWCRLRTSPAATGSFYAVVDDSAEFIFDGTAMNWRDTWHWIPVNNATGDWWMPNLDIGPHQFMFRTRETGSFLDEFILSNDPAWVPGIDPNPPVLTAAYSSTNRVDLAWTDTISNEDGFRIETSVDGVSFVELVSVTPGTTNYSDGNVILSAPQYYRVYGFNESDRTDYSNVAVAQTSGSGLPPAPPSSVSGDVVWRGRVRVTWTDNSADESGFLVERSRDGVSFESIWTTDANVTSAKDAMLLWGRYYYRIRSFNDFGSSLPSNVTVVDVYPWK